jgi:hypothetical protein
MKEERKVNLNLFSGFRISLINNFSMHKQMIEYFLKDKKLHNF